MNDSAASTRAFIGVTTLFFAWGLITSSIDPLIPTVREVFQLSYAQALLTQFAFFIAYGIVSLPGGMLVAKVGYGRSILGALITMIVGCLCFPLATHIESYSLVLLALFIVASGITVLQVAANPLAAALGNRSTSHFRLTLAQAFNSLGTVVGPWVGSAVMLSGGLFAGALDGSRGETLRRIDLAYGSIAGLLVLLVIFMWRMQTRLRSAAPPESGQPVSILAALKSKWAILGAVSIFFYVGAEVSVASVMINLLSSPDMLNVSLARAGALVGIFYWGGAMVGRFIGAAVLTRVEAPRLLCGAALGAALLCLCVSQGAGTAVSVAALAIGFCNSIMFPVIFTITLERSTAPAGSTSGLLCMAIVGGAVLPPLTGHIADTAGLHSAFWLPLGAYLVISSIAFAAVRAKTFNVAPSVAH